MWRGIIRSLKYMSPAILRAVFTWLALNIPWLKANMALEIRGVTELRSLPGIGGGEKLRSKRRVLTVAVRH
jgi:hypothetical protein